ncbi:hypothetical protein [Alicyclobacillus fodiniaquatilis]|uniref:Uncharacterized protein n=1 Tax=Alicyclobacillus fodiniaquatilis TaxID=1661150 RepID=A0ABW4JIJ3_9BACL
MTTVVEQTVGGHSGQEILFRMSPGQLPQLEIRENGVSHYKTVSVTQLLRLLDSSTTVRQLDKVEVRHNQIPALPEGTLLVDTIETPDNFDVIVTGWVPSMEYPFLYEDASYLIQVPTMVYQIRYRTQDKFVREFRLAITDQKTVTPSTPLYRWPFSNVYGDARVCWTATNFQCELHQVIEKGIFGFLQTTNNKDLFGLGKSHNSEYTSYESFLAAVAERGEVPTEWLIPLNKTVEQFHQH